MPPFLMGLGLHIGNQGAGGGGITPVDETTLAASGLWLGSFSGSPWSGTASAGASSGRNLSTLGTLPGTGSAVDGVTPATFNGTNQALTDGVNTAENYITTTAYTVSLLLKPTAAAADTTVYNNPGLVTETGGNWGIVYSDAGVRVYHQSATEATAALATGSWAQVDVVFSAGTLEIWVNRVLIDTQTAVATGSVTAAAFRVARNFGTAHFTGEMMRVFVSLAAQSEADLDGVYAYRKALYPAMSLP